MDADAKEFWHERGANRRSVWAYLSSSVVNRSGASNGTRNRKFAIPSASLHHPPVDRLMEIERSWNRHMRLEIFESRLLKSPVRRHVEGVGLAKQPLEPERLKIELHA